MSPAFPFPADAEAPANARPPTFLVYGAPRCGTTTLRSALALHPDVFMAPHKEPGYFAFAQDLGHPAPHQLGYYATRWPQYLHAFQGAVGAAAAGEATPFYLALPRAADAVMERVPDARLLVCLRDPVERALSHHRFHLRKGIGKTSFRAAWTNEGDMQPGGWSQAQALRDFGMYGQQLQALFSRVPQEHVLVFAFDDLVRRRQQTFQRIWQHIGVDAFEVPMMYPRNQGGPVREPVQRFLERPHWSKRVANVALPLGVRKAAWRALKRRAHHKPRASSKTIAMLHEHYKQDEALTQELLGWSPR